MEACGLRGLAACGGVQACGGRASVWGPVGVRERAGVWGYVRVCGGTCGRVEVRAV